MWLNDCSDLAMMLDAQWLPNLQILCCSLAHCLIALWCLVVDIASTRCQQIQSWLSGVRLTAFLSTRVKMSCSLSRLWMNLTPSSQVSHAFHTDVLMSIFMSTAVTWSYLGSAHCGQSFTSHAAQARSQDLPSHQMCQRTPFAIEESTVTWSILLHPSTQLGPVVLYPEHAIVTTTRSSWNASALRIHHVCFAYVIFAVLGSP